MKALHIVALFALSLSVITGCGKDDPVPPDPKPEEKPEGPASYWSEHMLVRAHALPADGKITIHWRLDEMEIGETKSTLDYYPPVADYYNVCRMDFAGECATITIVAKVDGFRIGIPENDWESFRYTVDDLENNIPYYFFITAHKEEYDYTIDSKPMMVIPNPMPVETSFFPEDGKAYPNFEVAVSLVNNKIAYGNTEAENPYLAIADLDGANEEIIAYGAYAPQWSVDGKKLVFYTIRQEEYKYYRCIAVYDTETKEIKELTPDTKYYNSTPAIDPTGTKILYEANVVDDYLRTTFFPYRYNLCLIDLNTMTEEVIVDGEQSNLGSVHSPDWIDEDRFLFEGAGTIYEGSISGKELKPIMESEWYDMNPTLSPDRQHIAFMSYRTGRVEVWVYTIETQTYKILSAFNQNSINVWGNNLAWLDNSTVYFTNADKKVVKVSIL